MFGYIGENSTPSGGHTNRADVNKLGYLFGGKGVWLPKTNPVTNRFWRNKFWAKTMGYQPFRFPSKRTCRGLQLSKTREHF